MSSPCFESCFARSLLPGACKSLWNPTKTRFSRDSSNYARCHARSPRVRTKRVIDVKKEITAIRPFPAPIESSKRSLDPRIHVTIVERQWYRENSSLWLGLLLFTLPQKEIDEFRKSSRCIRSESIWPRRIFPLTKKEGCITDDRRSVGRIF